MKADWTDHPCFEEEGRDGGRGASSSSSTSTTKYWDSSWERNEEGEREKIGGEPRNRLSRRQKVWFKPFQKIRLLLTIMWVCFQFVPVAEGQAIGTLISVGERRTTEFSVDNMNGLFNTLSNGGSNTGNSIMPNGDTAVLAVGVYKCSDGPCSDSTDMLSTSGLNGEVKCEEDTAVCVLNGEGTRRGMYVSGTGASTLYLRALTFQDAEGSPGGGVFIYSGAIVTIELCVFSNCRATDSSYGGGAIYVSYSGTTVNVYGTSFNDNTAASGNGDDIYREGGTITIHNTCPSPYSSNTPIRGEV